MTQHQQSSFESELLAVARELPDSQWCTSAYLTFEGGIILFREEGDETMLQQVCQDMEVILQRATHPYRDTPVGEHEVTIESVACHKLLMDGIAHWFTALDIARGAEDEAEWEEALGLAETGNRMLVALQVYYARLKSRA